MHNLLSHLTNFSLNKKSDKFVNSESVEDQNTESSKRTLSSVLHQLEQQHGIDPNQIFHNIKDVCTKTLVGIQPTALQEQGSLLDFQSCKGDCFQIMGFDIFIDKDLKAWLLEINESPSLSISADSESYS